MTTYTVLGTYDVRYTVEAESADEAAAIVEQGEAGNGEIGGASIDKVTSKYMYGAFWDDYEDERSHCACGHLIDQHFTAWNAVTDGEQAHSKKCHYFRCDCLNPVLSGAT